MKNPRQNQYHELIYLPSIPHGTDKQHSLDADPLRMWITFREEPDYHLASTACSNHLADEREIFESQPSCCIHGKRDVAGSLANSAMSPPLINFPA